MDAKRMLEAQIALHQAGFDTDEILALAKSRSGRKERSDKGLARGPYKTRSSQDGDTIARNDSMELLYRQGSTLDEIGQQYTITRERVRQILARRGITAVDGGAHLRVLASESMRMHDRKTLREQRSQHFFGCGIEEVKQLNDGLPLSLKGSFARIYTEQRKNAAARGIDWRITLAEYRKVWEDSGKWAERGRGKFKYCMCRTGDEGAYEIGNVTIHTNQKNGRDAQLNHAGMFIEPKWRRPPNRRDELGYTPRGRIARELIKGGIDTTMDLADAMGIKYGPAYAYMREVQRIEPHLLPKARNAV